MVIECGAVHTVRASQVTANYSELRFTCGRKSRAASITMLPVSCRDCGARENALIPDRTLELYRRRIAFAALLIDVYAKSSDAPPAIAVAA